MLRWTEGVRATLAGEVVAIDGKALRRATDRGAAGALPNFVSAWSADNGLVLEQVKVDDKSIEIIAIPALLRELELAGCIVAIDAMGSQKKIASEIVEADDDYLQALTGNHETVHREVKAYFDDAISRWQANPDADELDFSKKARRIAGASKPGASGRATRWGGLPTLTNGRGLRAWVRLSRSGMSGAL